MRKSEVENDEILVLAELGQDSIRVSAKECKDSAALDNSAENRWVGHTCSPLRLCLDLHVHYTVTSHVIRTVGGLYFVNQEKGQPIRQCAASLKTIS